MLVSRHAMTRKKRSIDAERNGWLPSRQLIQMPLQKTSYTGNYLYAPSNYTFGDDSSPKYQRDFQDLRKPQQHDLPRRNREFSNSVEFN